MGVVGYIHIHWDMKYTGNENKNGDATGLHAYVAATTSNPIKIEQGCNRRRVNAMTTNSAKCIACGKNIEDGSRFCRFCGKPQKPANDVNENEKMDDIGALVEDAIDTTLKVGKTIAKETIVVGKKLVKKVEKELDK